MNTLQFTSQFKKDLNKHKREVIDKLEVVLRLLTDGKPIPESNRPHLLNGNYRIIKDIWNVMLKAIRC